MEVKIVILRVADLGFLDATTTREIIGAADDIDDHGISAPYTKGRAREFGLELCLPEVALQFRKDYQSQPVDEQVYVAMKPIITSDGEPRIFVLGHNVGGLYLDAIRARPDDTWNPDNKFMFCT